MMNCQELANIKIKNKYLKIIILDNSGYSIIKQSGHFLNQIILTDVGSGKFDLPKYNVTNICKSYNLKTIEANLSNYKKRPKTLIQILIV